MGRQIKSHAAVGAQTKMHLGMGQGQTQNRLGDIGRLGGLGLQKLEARGRVEEQVAHFQLGSLGHADFARVGFDPCLDQQAEAGGGPAQLRAQGEARNRGDGGQRLTAKAEGRQTPQIVRRT